MISQRVSCSRSSSTDDDSDHEESLLLLKRNSSTRKKSYKKWNKDEDERLKEFIQSNGGVKDWSRISQYVGNGRTDAQCQHRWERFLDPSITKGPWTDEEDKKVIELVRDYGARQWSLIAKELKGRVGKQCRERWHNHLNPAINKNPWTNEENLLLFILHQHFGNKWAEIARHFNGRSDNSIKNHWNSSMKKKFELEVANLQQQGLEWTSLIPPDFSWPNLEKTAAPRTPLGTITNRTHRSNSKKSTTTITKQETLPSIVNSTVDHQHFFSPTDHNQIHLQSPQQMPVVYSEPLQPIPSSQSSPHPQSNHSSQNLETIFYCTPPSPAKPLPMLSSCADYTSSSQNSQSDVHLSLFPPSMDYFSYPPSRSSSLPTFTASSSPPHMIMLSPNHVQDHSHRQLFPNDDLFALHFQTQNENHIMIKSDPEHLLIDLTHSQQHQSIVISPQTISNTSSPSKHRVLNTPERLIQPHQIRLTEHDWFNDLMSYPDSNLSLTTELEANNKENCSSIRAGVVRRNKRLNKYQSTMNETRRRENFARNLFHSSKKLREELGYDPTYTEILTGQTRDQRFVTEQARRYLSCSSLNHTTS